MSKPEFDEHADYVAALRTTCLGFSEETKRLHDFLKKLGLAENFINRLTIGSATEIEIEAALKGPPKQ